MRSEIAQALSGRVPAEAIAPVPDDRLILDLKEAARRSADGGNTGHAILLAHAAVRLKQLVDAGRRALSEDPR